VLNNVILGNVAITNSTIFNVRLATVFSLSVSVWSQSSSCMFPVPLLLSTSWNAQRSSNEPTRCLEETGRIIREALTSVTSHVRGVAKLCLGEYRTTVCILTNILKHIQTIISLPYLLL